MSESYHLSVSCGSHKVFFASVPLSQHVDSVSRGGSLYFLWDVALLLYTLSCKDIYWHV